MNNMSFSNKFVNRYNGENFSRLFAGILPRMREFMLYGFIILVGLSLLPHIMLLLVILFPLL